MTSRPDPRRPVRSGPASTEDLPEVEFLALVGAWSVPTPSEVVDLLAGMDVRWWIAGGWALELAGARPRPHKDTDVAFAIDDLPALRTGLADRGLDLWCPSPDGYRPLLPADTCREDEEQFWIREDATHPWLVDLLATPTDGHDWVFKKDARIRRPLADVTARTPDGIAYLSPEIVLLHKATHTGPPPQPPSGAFELLDPPALIWLTGALATVSPTHPWLDHLSE